MDYLGTRKALSPSSSSSSSSVVGSSLYATRARWVPQRLPRERKRQRDFDERRAAKEEVRKGDGKRERERERQTCLRFRRTRKVCARSISSSHRRRPLAMDGDDDDNRKARAEEDAGGGGGGEGGEGRRRRRARTNATTPSDDEEYETPRPSNRFGGNGWDGGLRRDTSGLSIASSQGKRSRSDLLAAAAEEEKVCVVETDDAAAAAAKSLRPTSTAEAMRVGATSEDLTQAEFVNGSNSNSLGESPTTRLGYLNQATFDSNKSKRGVFGSGHNNNSSTTSEGKREARWRRLWGETNMLAENSAVASGVGCSCGESAEPRGRHELKVIESSVDGNVGRDGTDLSAMGGD